MLLELRLYRVLRVRAGVRVTRVVGRAARRTAAGRACSASSTRTLRGHVEMGRMDYEVGKRLDDGRGRVPPARPSRAPPTRARPGCGWAFACSAAASSCASIYRCCDRIARLTARELDLPEIRPRRAWRPSLDAWHASGSWSTSSTPSRSGTPSRRCTTPSATTPPTRRARSRRAQRRHAPSSSPTSARSSSTPTRSTTRSSSRADSARAARRSRASGTGCSTTPRRHQAFQLELFPGMRDYYAASDAHLVARRAAPSPAPAARLPPAPAAALRACDARRARRSARWIAVMPAGSSEPRALPVARARGGSSSTRYTRRSPRPLALIGRCQRDEHLERARAQPRCSTIPRTPSTASTSPLAEQLAMVKACDAVPLARTPASASPRSPSARPG